MKFGGVVAKRIRKRFDDDLAQELLSLEWWNWDDKKIARFAPYMTAPEKFVAEAEEKTE